MAWYRSIAIFLAVTFAITAAANAQGRGFKLFKKKPSRESLELTREVGPWVIMCYSFSGPDGAQQAKRLATELRESYRLDAYTYTHRIDLTSKIKQHALVGKQFVKDQNGNEILGADGKPLLVEENMVAASGPESVETAVVIGSFQSLEDDSAQRQLKALKSLKPQSLSGGRDSIRSATNELNDERAFSRSMLDQSNASLKNSFLIPNPLLPDEYFKARSIDPFIVNINKKVKYSLLDCPGTYSVRVATFRGRTIVDAREMKQKIDDFSWRKRMGKGVESELDRCMEKARLLTKALRKERVEAWVFHDREESYVCVGSFDWLKKSDGGIEIQNPLVRDTIKKYKGTIKYRPNGAPVRLGRPVPKSLRHLKNKDAIAFDVQPLPVICPKAPKSRTAELLDKLKIR